MAVVTETVLGAVLFCVSLGLLPRSIAPYLVLTMPWSWYSFFQRRVRDRKSPSEDEKWNWLASFLVSAGQSALGLAEWGKVNNGSLSWKCDDWIIEAPKTQKFLLNFPSLVFILKACLWSLNSWLGENKLLLHGLPQTEPINLSLLQQIQTSMSV